MVDKKIQCEYCFKFIKEEEYEIHTELCKFRMMGY